MSNSFLWKKHLQWVSSHCFREIILLWLFLFKEFELEVMEFKSHLTTRYFYQVHCFEMFALVFCCLYILYFVGLCDDVWHGTTFSRLSSFYFRVDSVFFEKTVTKWWKRNCCKSEIWEVINTLPPDVIRATLLLIIILKGVSEIECFDFGERKQLFINNVLLQIVHDQYIKV